MTAQTMETMPEPAKSNTTRDNFEAIYAKIMLFGQQSKFCLGACDV